MSKPETQIEAVLQEGHPENQPLPRDRRGEGIRIVHPDDFGKIQILIERDGQIKEEVITPLDLLETAYAKNTYSLDREEKELVRKRDELIEAVKNLNPITEAKLRVLDRDRDESLSRGDLKKTKRIEDEIGEVKAHREALSLQITQANERLEVIAQEKIIRARQTLNQVYPLLKQATFDAIDRAVTLLEKTWEGLQSFGDQRKTGYMLNYLNGLTPFPIGLERPLRERVSKWF